MQQKPLDIVLAELRPFKDNPREYIESHPECNSLEKILELFHFSTKGIERIKNKDMTILDVFITEPAALVALPRHVELFGLTKP